MAWRSGRRWTMTSWTNKTPFNNHWIAWPWTNSTATYKSRTSKPKSNPNSHHSHHHLCHKVNPNPALVASSRHGTRSNSSQRLNWRRTTRILLRLILIVSWVGYLIYGRMPKEELRIRISLPIWAPLMAGWSLWAFPPVWAWPRRGHSAVLRKRSHRGKGRFTFSSSNTLRSKSIEPTYKSMASSSDSLTLSQLP